MTLWGVEPSVSADHAIATEEARQLAFRIWAAAVCADLLGRGVRR